jgi:hypothetical protein
MLGQPAKWGGFHRFLLEDTAWTSASSRNFDLKARPRRPERNRSSPNRSASLADSRGFRYTQVNAIATAGQAVTRLVTC